MNTILFFQAVKMCHHDLVPSDEMSFVKFVRMLQACIDVACNFRFSRNENSQNAVSHTDTVSVLSCDSRWSYYQETFPFGLQKAMICCCYKSFSSVSKGVEKEETLRMNVYLWSVLIKVVNAHFRRTEFIISLKLVAGRSLIIVELTRSLAVKVDPLCIAVGTKRGLDTVAWSLNTKV